MVETPWGSSESLRERRLRPGPANTPADAASNQRERLFGAMVASVAVRGYAATRLADLCELSGVSSKSFYDHFPDKEGCLLATIDALFEAIPGGEAVAPEASWEDRVVGSAVAFGRLVARQPAAAKLLLIEAYAAGPAVVERIRRAWRGVEGRAFATARQSPDWELVPDEMITAYLGGVADLARSRLRVGAERSLPEELETLCRALLDRYSPPPEPLRPTSRWSPPAAESLDAPDHAERIVQALTTVVAEHGYAEMTIEQIVKRAGISASKFYANFPGKEEALLAAIDSAASRALAAVMPAFRRSADWPASVRASLGALFGFFAGHPALARLLLIEVYAAGPGALERRGEALRPLQVLWAEARRRSPELPRVVEEATMGGLYHLASQRILAAGPSGLPELAPLCTYLVLVPYVGSQAAWAAAAGRDEAAPLRAPDPEAVRAAALVPLRQDVLRVVCQRPVTLREIAAELDQPEDVVGQQLAELERARLVERIGGRAESGMGVYDSVLGENVYNSFMGEIHTEEWSRLNPQERELITGQVLELVRADVERSIEGGLLDARPERVLVRAPLQVDLRGWRELSELHTQTLAGALEIQGRAAERLKKSGEDPLEVRNVQALFQVPPSDDAP